MNKDILPAYNQLYDARLNLINDGLNQLAGQRQDCPVILQKAMEYSLFAGGKRLRPILLLSAYELASDSPEDFSSHCISMACAVEMIHTYSLIHDDLPAMDDDDFRRGKPTNHKVFGEAMAILAGDGLLNLAYEIMLENIPGPNYNVSGYIDAMRVISASAGISGMIGGQAVDINNEAGIIGEDILSYIHKHKTEALITAALHAGILLNTDDGAIIDAATAYGHALGMAFQITDDLLDITGDLSHLGKKPGSDTNKNKLTFPARFGIDGSRRMAEQYIDAAISSLDRFGSRGDFLRQLAISILLREK